jgi:hypothetical protein
MGSGSSKVEPVSGTLEKVVVEQPPTAIPIAGTSNKNTLNINGNGNRNRNRNGNGNGKQSPIPQNNMAGGKRRTRKQKKSRKAKKTTSRKH